MLNNKIILILVVISQINFISILAGADDNSFGWSPRFYENSIQEGRNICLGIIIADNSEPGIDSTFSVGGYIYNSDTTWFLFEERKFSKGEAAASIKSKYKNDNGDNYTLFIFIVPDVCLTDETVKYRYRLYDNGFPDNFPHDVFYLNVIGIDFIETNEECGEVTDETCSSLDLTEFYSWEAEEDDDTPEADDDNDDTNSSDDENNDDDECNCGCDVSGRATSFPLALFMFAIGIAAWAISRRARKK